MHPFYKRGTHRRLKNSFFKMKNKSNKPANLDSFSLKCKVFFIHGGGLISLRKECYTYNQKVSTKECQEGIFLEKRNLIGQVISNLELHQVRHHIILLSLVLPSSFLPCIFPFIPYPFTTLLLSV